jgi:hypothetical protein
MTGGKGSKSAKGSARGTPPGRRDRSRHHGGADRDGRDSGQFEIGPRSQWAGGRKGTRKKPFSKATISNRKVRRSQKVERAQMSNPEGRPQSIEDAAAAMARQLQEAQASQQMQAIQLALSGSVQRLYASQVAVAQTSSDIPLVLLTNNTAVAVINVSYVTAKSLMVDLQRVIEAFETASNTKVPTMEEITPKLARTMTDKNAQKLS